MKTTTILALALALLIVAPPIHAANPRMFSDIKTAVEYARINKRLLLFALLDVNSSASQEVASMLNDNRLELSPDEFVLVTCEASNAGHAQLFSRTFEENTSKTPIVVITDSTGKKLGSLSGLNADESYGAIVMEALIEAGLRTRPEVASAGTGGGEMIEGGSLIFRVTKDDVGPGDVVVSDYRVWTLKNGETFNGAVLKAEGEFGTFKLEDNSVANVKFIDLSDEDIKYLETVLKAG